MGKLDVSLGFKADKFDWRGWRVCIKKQWAVKLEERFGAWF